MTRLPMVALALIGLLGACGGSRPGTPDGLSLSPPGVSRSPIPGEPDPVTSSAKAAASTGVGGSTASTSPSPLPSGPAKHNTMPLNVTLNRLCARTGDEMQATATTTAGAKIALAAAYSGKNLGPDFTYVPSEGNPTGTFTWTWVIRPDIPPGDALLNVTVAKDGKGASFDQPFRIATSC